MATILLLYLATLLPIKNTPNHLAKLNFQNVIRVQKIRITPLLIRVH